MRLHLIAGAMRLNLFLNLSGVSAFNRLLGQTLRQVSRDVMRSTERFGAEREMAAFDTKPTDSIGQRNPTLVENRVLRGCR